MSPVLTNSSLEEVGRRNGSDPNDELSTIRCYAHSVLGPKAWPTVLSGERLLAAEAMRLLLRLDSELMEARAEWNQDRFRRVMHMRPKALARLLRRWARVNPSPSRPLGSLRRRYHSNLAKYLYDPAQ